MRDDFGVSMATTEITTLCVLGFPPDLTAREVRNLCRFMPGFEDAHVVKSGTLFVKFMTAELGAAAIAALNGQSFDEEQPQHVMRAEFAKRELEPRRNPAQVAFPFSQQAALAQTLAPGLGQAQMAFAHQQGLLGANPGLMQALGLGQFQQSVDALQAAAAQAQYGMAPGCCGGLLPMQASFASANVFPGGQPGGSMAKPQVAPNDVNTITVIGAERKGVSREEVKTWFQQLPGFVTLQVNDRIDAIFVKFVSHEVAAQAMQEANAVGLGAEWARRNLEEHTGSQAAPAAVGGYGGGCGGPCGGATKRPRVEGSPGGEPDTIAVLGVRKRGQNFDVLTEFFQSKPGFEKMKVQESIDGIFVKFSCRELAEQVLRDANAMQFGAEFARRNLE